MAAASCAPTDTGAEPEPTQSPRPSTTVQQDDRSADIGRSEATPRAAVDVEPPVGVSIPSADIASRVVSVGVRDDGQMELPDDPQVLGWYRFGPAPGGSGSTVLGGHVDGVEQGLGPLSRLVDIAVGADVTVEMRDGEPVPYRVDSVESVPRTDLGSLGIFRRSGEEQIVIVTCGGDYDRAAGAYEENVIVTASPVP